MGSEPLTQSRESLVLRDDRIIQTIARLQQRIRDRFPDSGLSDLCARLHQVALHASERAATISSPIRSIRIAGYATAVLLVGSFIEVIVLALQHSDDEQIGFTGWVGAVEAGLNVVIFLALALWFLISLETRIKRQRAIAAIHELRSIAHVIDMHQLTKDPERTLPTWSATAHSPEAVMTPLQLNRYLDYCSEMLSLVGKIAALYIQRFGDPAAVAAVSEVEQLTTGLSRKIWQKIIATQNVRFMEEHSADEPTDPAGGPERCGDRDVDGEQTLGDTSVTVENGERPDLSGAGRDPSKRQSR